MDEDHNGSGGSRAFSDGGGGGGRRKGVIPSCQIVGACGRGGDGHRIFVGVVGSSSTAEDGEQKHANEGTCRSVFSRSCVLVGEYCGED